MSHAIRRLFACLLLVLLPFQALAVGDAASKAPLMACPAAMMAEMDCCDGAGGCSALDCLAVAPAALPSSALPALAAGAHPEPAPTAALLHESYLPDGPQRPPQVRA